MLSSTPYFAKLYIAGRLADAGWNVYFPHRDEEFDFVISKVIDGVPLLRPVQVRGEYPSEEKGDPIAVGSEDKLTQTHPETVLAIPYFSITSPQIPICVAYLPRASLKSHALGFRCQPATYRRGKPYPRKKYQKYFDDIGIQRLDSEGWSRDFGG
jgi:hypothetical protein